jgi:biopolymer transport protein ExbD
MAISGLPGGEGEDSGIVAEINITPLTDIFLVLLIIFMVTSTVIVEEGKNIDLPNADVAEETTPDGVTVTVNAEGEILVNDVVAEKDKIQKMLELAIAKAEDKIVVLRGDRTVMLGTAVNILDLAQKAGAQGIALSTEPPKETMEYQ